MLTTRRTALKTVALAATLFAVGPQRVKAQSAFGNVTVDATFNVIGYRWDVLADAPISTIDVTYRETSPNVTSWKAANPARLIDRRAAGFYRAITGSVFVLQPARTYEVTVRAYDAQSNLLGEKTFSALTKADNITLPSNLAPTHYVATNGDDANPGTQTQPWRTLTRASQAPAMSVIQVGYGHFQAPPTLTKSMTFVAKSASVMGVSPSTFAVTLRAPEQRTYIYQRMIAPATSTLPDDQPYKGGWTQTTIGAYTVWTRDMGTVDVQTVAWRRCDTTDYQTQKNLKLQRLPIWQATNGPQTLIATKERWAQMLFENASGLRYGLYQPPGSAVAYLVLPENVNPNECWLFYAAGSGTSPIAECGFNLEAPDSRVTGFVIRGVANGIRVAITSQKAILTHNVFDCCRTPILLNGADDDRTIDDVVIQDSLARGTSVVNTGEYSYPAVGWAAVKVGVVDPATNDFYIADNGVKGGKYLGNMENSAVSFRKGARRTVIRRFRVEGLFNGFSGTGDRPSDINNVDLIDTFCRYIADNCWEPEGQVENFRILRSRAEWANTAGASSLEGGPIYVQDAIAYRTTNRLLSPIRTSVPGDAYTGGAVAWKWGNGAPGVVIQDHVTYWSDQTRKSGNGMDGYDHANSGYGTVWVDNSVITRVTGKVTDSPTQQVRVLTDCVEAGSSNPTLVSQIDAALPNAASGDLTPSSGSILAGKGARQHLQPVAELVYV